MDHTEKKKITGICFGTFDSLHPGHLDFFRQAKQRCDYLYVLVARDRNVEKIKGSLPCRQEEDRLLDVKRAAEADKAFLGEIKDKYKPIKRLKPNIVFLGYDQEANLEELKEIHTGEIIRLNPHHPFIYKSSKINVCRYCPDNRRA